MSAAKKPDQSPGSGPVHKTAPDLPLSVAKEWGIDHLANDTHHELADTFQPDPLADPKTEQAVDDIVAKESDQLLADQDANAPAVGHRTFWQKISFFFYGWWCNAWARNLTLIVLLLSMMALLAVPASRYTVLNTVGVRSSASVVVLDNTTHLPLGNVTVELAGQKTKTDAQGRAKFEDLRLGTETLLIRRIAFAPVERTVTIGWGSNPLGAFRLTATGAQYTLTVVDYLSGKPIEQAEAMSDGLIARADKQGKITLTIDAKNVTELPVTVKATGYRAEQLTLKLTEDAPPRHELVPQYRSVFVAKQQGRYDLCAVDLDGKNRQIILPGTGKENNNLTVGTSADNSRAALVSTRDGSRSADGFVLSTLTLVTIADGSSMPLDKGEQIRLIDWIGTKLIYQVTTAGASAANSNRHRIISYDYVTKSRVQLANANLFNSVISARGTIYYAVSGTDPAAKPGFYAIQPDGTNREVLMTEEVWTVIRTDYDTLYLQSPGNWYNYKLLGNNPPAHTEDPGAYEGRLYVDDAARSASASIDRRNGKNALITRMVATGKESILFEQSDITHPIRWAGKGVIVYRVSSGETADYAISIHGGGARKIMDVTNAYGFTQSQ